MDIKEIEPKTKIIRPQEGFQEQFLSSTADIVIGGGSAGAGKSFSLILESLYDIDNPEFRAVYFRKHLKELTPLIVESKKRFSKVVPTPTYNESKYVWNFPSGATVAFDHLQYEKDKENHQGQEYALICFDELTHFCLHPETEVLTENGWENIAELKIGTKAASLNEKEEVEYKEILNLHTYDYNGKLKCVKQKNGVQFRATPNHKAVVMKQKSYINENGDRRTKLDGWKFQKVKELKTCTIPIGLKDKLYTTIKENDWYEEDYNGKIYCPEIQDNHNFYIRVNGRACWTGNSFSQFVYLISRNRSTSGALTRIKATCNPEADHWVAKLIDWWIADNGFPIAERSGKLRYFIATGDSIDKFIWGDTYEEVVEKGAHVINNLIKSDDSDLVSERDFIKSITFIPGNVYENKELLKINPGYIGSLVAQGEAGRKTLLEGNWKFRPKGDELVNSEIMEEMFNRYPQTNGRVCITSDVAGKGSDRMIVLVWNGFHLMDISVISRSNGKEIVNAILGMMRRYHVSQENVIFDANGVGSHIDGFIPNAVEYRSQAKPLNGEYYANLKSQCSIRWANRMKGDLVNNTENLNYSIESSLVDMVIDGKTMYEHLQHEKKAIRLTPRSVNGKPEIIKKSEMISIIGHSPDFIESICMLEYFYMDGELYDGYINCW